jgi:hypothetical protein
LKQAGGADVILVTSNSYKAATESLKRLCPDGRMVLIRFSEEPLIVTSEILGNRSCIIGSIQNDQEYSYEALDYVARVSNEIFVPKYSRISSACRMTVPAGSSGHVSKLQYVSKLHQRLRCQLQTLMRRLYYSTAILIHIRQFNIDPWSFTGHRCILPLQSIHDKTLQFSCVSLGSEQWGQVCSQKTPVPLTIALALEQSKSGYYIENVRLFAMFHMPHQLIISNQ